MMTLEMITNKLDTVREDVEYTVFGDLIDVTILDFEGFTEDWEEVERQLEDGEAVNRVLDWLEEHADRVEGHYYKDLYFGEYKLTIGYASFDI